MGKIKQGRHDKVCNPKSIQSSYQGWSYIMSFGEVDRINFITFASTRNICPIYT